MTEHRVCLPLERSQQGVRNWRRTLAEAMHRAERLPSRRLPRTTAERIATIATQLAHFGRCVQIHHEKGSDDANS